MTQTNPPILTDEQHSRLEAIFHPEAMRQRNKIGFTKDGDFIRFVHYTSADAAMKLIGKKCVWMRNTTCMSDFSEVEHGYGMLLSFFSEKKNEQAFTQALDSCHNGASSSVYGSVNSWGTLFRYDTFITSISEHATSEDQNGRLSMWRAYGGASGRVAIVFKIPYAATGTYKLNLTFSPVAYLTQERAHEVLREIIENVKRDEEFLKSLHPAHVIVQASYSLVVGAICCKHPGFAEEVEWRLIYMPTVQASGLMKPLIETINGIPQLVYPIPLDGKEGLDDLDFARLFDRLIIGPTQYPLAMERAFRKALLETGCESPTIVLSEIPIRT